MEDFFGDDPNILNILLSASDIHENVSTEEGAHPSTSSSQFSSFSKLDDVSKKISDSVPRSTKYKQKWAKNMFVRYNSARNEEILNTSSEELMVLYPLEQMSKGDVAYLLPLFINDARL